MFAGKLDRRIDLLKRRTVQNALGEQQEIFECAVTLWAQAMPSRGRDYFAAAQVHSEETMTFRIRFRTDVDVKDRIGFGGNQYNIVNVAEVGRREGLEIVGTQAQN